MRPDSVWAVVPLKGLREGKSRLAPLLSAEERARLMARMLTRVVAAASRAGLAGALVVTREAEAARLADELGARVLGEEGEGLNAALRPALRWVAARAPAALILPADLPLVTPEELAELLSSAPPPPCAVIAPSPDGGTNALLLAPPMCLEPAFGRRSAARHQRLARQAGLRVGRFRAPGLALDIDGPQELATYLERSAQPLPGLGPG